MNISTIVEIIRVYETLILAKLLCFFDYQQFIMTILMEKFSPLISIFEIIYCIIVVYVFLLFNEDKIIQC